MTCEPTAEVITQANRLCSTCEPLRNQAGVLILERRGSGRALHSGHTGFFLKHKPCHAEENSEIGIGIEEASNYTKQDTIAGHMMTICHLGRKTCADGFCCWFCISWINTRDV